MTAQTRTALVEIIAAMRAKVQKPDDLDAGSVWAWRLDEWADQLAAIDAAPPSLPTAREVLESLRAELWEHEYDCTEDFSEAIDAKLASLSSSATETGEPT